MPEPARGWFAIMRKNKITCPFYGFRRDPAGDTPVTGSDNIASASVEQEPKLTFRLSDRHEFYCSACPNPIASIGNLQPVRSAVARMAAHWPLDERSCGGLLDNSSPLLQSRKQGKACVRVARIRGLDSCCVDRMHHRTHGNRPLCEVGLDERVNRGSFQW
jgi:hypothetical protein